MEDPTPATRSPRRWPVIVAVAGGALLAGGAAGYALGDDGTDSRAAARTTQRQVRQLQREGEAFADVAQTEYALQAQRLQTAFAEYAAAAEAARHRDDVRRAKAQLARQQAVIQQVADEAQRLADRERAWARQVANAKARAAVLARAERAAAAARRAEQVRKEAARLEREAAAGSAAALAELRAYGRVLAKASAQLQTLLRALAVAQSAAEADRIIEQIAEELAKQPSDPVSPTSPVTTTPADVVQPDEPGTVTTS